MQKTADWGQKWKTYFNKDVKQHGQEIILPRKLEREVDSKLALNSPVARSDLQKYLGLYLNTKFDLHYHVKKKLKQTDEGVNFIRTLSILYEN